MRKYNVPQANIFLASTEQESYSATLYYCQNKMQAKIGEKNKQTSHHRAKLLNN